MFALGGSIVWCFPTKFDDGFFGILEVTPHARLGWTNDEGDNGKTVTTVTFEENGGKTLLVVHDRYPSKEALDWDRRAGCPRRSTNSTSFSPAWAPVPRRNDATDASNKRFRRTGGVRSSEAAFLLMTPVTTDCGAAEADDGQRLRPFSEDRRGELDDRHRALQTKNKALVEITLPKDANIHAICPARTS